MRPGQPGPGRGATPGWLSRSRMALSQPWMAIVPHLLRSHGWPDALRLAQEVIRRWATPLARLAAWRGLSGYVQGSRLGLEYIYRTRQLRQWRRPPRTTTSAMPPPGLTFAPSAFSAPAPWQPEEEAAPSAEAPAQMEPASIPAPSLAPPEEGRQQAGLPEAWVSAPLPQEAPGTTHWLAQPSWPQRGSKLTMLSMPGLAAQVLARWGSAHAARSAPSVRALQMAVRRLHRMGTSAPTALPHEVLSRHGVVPQPAMAPPPALMRVEGPTIETRATQPTEIEEQSVSGRGQPILPEPSRPFPRLPHRLTDRPMALFKVEAGGEATPLYRQRLTALAEDVFIRHGIMPPAPAQRQPFEPPGMMPRWLRRGADRPPTRGRVAAMTVELPSAAPSSEAGPAPQTTLGPPATAPRPEAIAGEPVSAQPPSAQAAQPAASPGAPVPEARATPQEIETPRERETAERQVPQPRPPHRFSGPPAPQGQWATSLSRQILSRYAITTSALTRPGLILRLRRHRLDAETVLPPHRLTAWPEDILTRYGLFSASAQPPVLEGGWIQPPGVAPDIEGESEARPRAPEAVRRLPRWRPRGLGRLAAEALKRTLGLTTGEQAARPAKPGEGWPLQSALSLPSFSTTEEERAKKIVVRRSADDRQRAIPPKAEAGQHGSMPGSAIVPEVLARATGWLAPRAEAALSFLDAVGAVLGPGPQEGTAQAQREWPALGLLQRLARPARSGEPAALQVLRRLSPAQRRPALAAIWSLPSLGAGEPLPTIVRRPMEALLGRDLASVRLYTSPVASALGAEALTSGERIVFAPGRLDVRSRRGLALIGHELAHVGQPLAFKQSPGAGPAVVDKEESEAERQEAIIRRIAEEGWPMGPRMEVRRRAWTTDDRRPSSIVSPSVVPRQSSVLDSATGLRFERLTVQPGPAQPVIQRARADGRGPVGPFSESAIAPAAIGADQPGAPDLNALAQQVYSLLKARLRAERDRHQLYPR